MDRNNKDYPKTSYCKSLKCTADSIKCIEELLGCLGGSLCWVSYLILAHDQVMIRRSWDWALHQVLCYAQSLPKILRFSLSLLLALSAFLSLSFSFSIKKKKPLGNSQILKNDTLHRDKNNTSDGELLIRNIGAQKKIEIMYFWTL